MFPKDVVSLWLWEFIATEFGSSLTKAVGKGCCVSGRLFFTASEVPILKILGVGTRILK